MVSGLFVLAVTLSALTAGAWFALGIGMDWDDRRTPLGSGLVLPTIGSVLTALGLTVLQITAWSVWGIMQSGAS